MSSEPVLSDIYQRRDVAERYIDWLRFGKPEMGWGGDHSLTLAFNAGIEQRWELLRHAPVRGYPDRHEIVMVAPAGFELNESGVIALIQNLIAHDTHRAGNSALEQFDRMQEENARKERAQLDAAADATSEALGKFYTEAGKTLGVTKTFFPT